MFWKLLRLVAKVKHIEGSVPVDSLVVAAENMADLLEVVLCFCWQNPIFLPDMSFKLVKMEQVVKVI